MTTKTRLGLGRPRETLEAIAAGCVRRPECDAWGVVTGLECRGCDQARLVLLGYLVSRSGFTLDAKLR